MGKWKKVVSLVIRECAGRFRVRISAASKYFFFSRTFRPTLESSQSPIQWVLRTFFPVENRPEREVYHSLPFPAYVKCTYVTSTSPSCLYIMDRDKFIFFSLSSQTFQSTLLTHDSRASFLIPRFLLDRTQISKPFHSNWFLVQFLLSET